MKKLLAVAAALLLTAGSLSAQEVVPVVKAGAKSLNFTFGGLGAFGIGGSGINAGFGGSYFASPNVAYRLGIQGNYWRSTIPWNDNSLNGTDPGSDGSNSYTSVAVGFDYLMYLDGISQRVRPYWGPGVSAMYQTSRAVHSVSNNAVGGTLLEEKNNSGSDGLTFGVSGILGAEFFIYPELSLSAEYKLTLLSLTSRADGVAIYKNLPDRTHKQGSTMQIFGIGTGGVILHIYF